ncbi:MAG: hypothetical protein VCD50_14540 [Alphaproteobacteria bacterium]
MSEITAATTELKLPSKPEKHYQIHRDGVLYSLFLGTRAKASGHVQSLFNINPSLNWDYELAA